MLVLLYYMLFVLQPQKDLIWGRKAIYKLQDSGACLHPSLPWGSLSFTTPHALCTREFQFKNVGFLPPLVTCRLLSPEMGFLTCLMAVAPLPRSQESNISISITGLTGDQSVYLANSAHFTLRKRCKNHILKIVVKSHQSWNVSKINRKIIIAIPVIQGVKSFMEH